MEVYELFWMRKEHLLLHLVVSYTHTFNVMFCATHDIEDPWDPFIEVSIYNG